MLIQNGADINIRKYKQEDLEALDWVSDYQPIEMTLLEIAKERNYVEVINVLIAAGARD